MITSNAGKYVKYHRRNDSLMCEHCEGVKIVINSITGISCTSGHISINLVTVFAQFKKKVSQVMLSCHLCLFFCLSLRKICGRIFAKIL